MQDGVPQGREQGVVEETYWKWFIWWAWKMSDVHRSGVHTLESCTPAVCDAHNCFHAQHSEQLFYDFSAESEARGLI